MKILFIALSLVLLLTTFIKCEPLIITAAALALEGLGLASTIITVAQPFLDLNKENYDETFKRNLEEIAKKVNYWCTLLRKKELNITKI